jgi:hypothetical protein
VTAAKNKIADIQPTIAKIHSKKLRNLIDVVRANRPEPIVKIPTKYTTALIEIILSGRNNEIKIKKIPINTVRALFFVVILCFQCK